MDLSTRVFRLMKSLAEEGVDSVGGFFNQGKTMMDESLNSWEERVENKQRTAGGNEEKGGQERYKTESNRSTSSSKDVPQVTTDLQLFGLTPPSSLAELKKARNREIKKYHPDRFSNDPEKLKTAQEIMQIYNEVYDRLQDHYRRTEGK
ncbi:MAG: hypothetical protein COB67_03820 [SAR324 cluster bacterium]|uniref:J domain-containing protein n=1 Tax=SAR324 cluster bacterium TaxID=2024889 RepID=A0A2A4T7J1_9DELT|nr:MAG: hypothetical protein COB67_03820 [SAR324 cluster bacterium]